MTSAADLQRYYDVSLPPSLWGGGAAPELLQQAAPVLPGDVDQFTVAQVQAWVAEHPDEAAQVLAAEQAGKNRTTLVDWLTAQSAEPDSE